MLSDFLETYKNKLNAVLKPFDDRTNIRFLREGICLPNIYRYTSFSNLIMMLDGYMRFSLRSSFPDRHEQGDFLSEYLKVCNSNIIDKKRKNFYKKRENLIQLSTFFHASCWTFNNCECYPLWKAYTTNEYGVMITSSLPNLLSSIYVNEQQSLYCAPISYGEEKLNIDPYDILFSKTSEYSFENEIRFYVIPNLLRHESHPHTLWLKCKPEIAVEEITLSPFLQPNIATSIADMLIRRYHFLESKISKSTIIEY